MIRLSGLRVGTDVEVEFIGIRPGEKLHEELHGNGEKHLDTSHSKIMVAASAPMNLLKIRASIDRLSQIGASDESKIVALLGTVVPELQRMKPSISDRREAA